jgi:hypothetical protein
LVANVLKCGKPLIWFIESGLKNDIAEGAYSIYHVKLIAQHCEIDKNQRPGHCKFANGFMAGCFYNKLFEEIAGFLVAHQKR